MRKTWRSRIRKAFQFHTQGHDPEDVRESHAAPHRKQTASSVPFGITCAHTKNMKVAATTVSLNLGVGNC